MSDVRALFYCPVATGRQAGSLTARRAAAAAFAERHGFTILREHADDRGAGEAPGCDRPGPAQERRPS
jgi:hypothetical protein